MIIARVVGSVVATIKCDKLSARKLLIVQRASPRNELLEVDPIVAVDSVGAGEGELVLVALGSAGRQTSLTEQAPADATIVGIIDSLEIDGRDTFRKS